MGKLSISSVIGGILVILIALTAVGMITSYYFYGLHVVEEAHALSNWLTYKDMEQLAVVYNDTSHVLIIKNMWNYPSTITFIVDNESGTLKFISENITIFPGGSVSLRISGDPISVLTAFGNEFWAVSTAPNPYFSTYAVTIMSGKGGTTDPAPGTYYYPYGSKLTITAKPNRNYVFVGWSGTGYGSYTGSDNPATVYVWSNITETASFNR